MCTCDLFKNSKIGVFNVDAIKDYMRKTMKIEVDFLKAVKKKQLPCCACSNCVCHVPVKKQLPSLYKYLEYYFNFITFNIFFDLIFFILFNVIKMKYYSKTNF